MATNKLIEEYEIAPEVDGFHITDNKIAEFRNNLITATWPATEAVPDDSMNLDRDQFNNMTTAERQFITGSLVLFLIADDFVDEVIEDEIVHRVKNRIWRGYEFQKQAMEDIHSETYRLLLEGLVPGQVDEISRTVRERYTFITDKVDWCRRSMGQDPVSSSDVRTPTRLAHCVFVMTIIELIFFSTSFAIIFWYKSNNKLPQISYANEMIARDEGAHGEFDIYIYNTLKHRLSHEEAALIMSEAVALECLFVEAVTPDIIGINKKTLCMYAQFMADGVMQELGYAPIYGIKECPIPYMVEFGIRRKTDFFRKKENSYQRFKKELFVPWDVENLKFNN